MQYVTKRNGQLEKFDINKILQWELWACSDIKAHINWRDIILKVKTQLRDKMPTQEVQLKLIEECNNRQSWLHSLVAGRLYASYMSKQIFDHPYPLVKDLHTQLATSGVMLATDYTDEEYEQIERLIDHSRDFQMAYMQVHQLTSKYALTDRVTRKRFETPQYIFMRMAMALSHDEPNRMERVAKFYHYFSTFKINAPTPNYVNLGTSHRGYISCCLYSAGDSASSLAIGDHIAYTMTYMSAGIGGHLNTRSVGDPVRGGSIRHMGKLPYLRSVAGAVNANMQSSRGGACTQYFSCFDPEATDMIYLQNPRTPVSKQNRDLHLCMQFNDFFVEKVANNEEIFSFNNYTEPALMQAFFAGDAGHFKKLYLERERDASVKRTYTNARELMLKALRQCHEVATLYLMSMDEVNHHNAFKDPVYISNLCTEIMQPTMPYESMEDLYSSEDHGRGEISLCGLAAIVPSNVTDEEYEDVAYHALLMVDKCIDLNDYIFPHLEVTAKARRNAGVGLLGIAYDLAKAGLTFSSKEGLALVHRIAERHMYWLIKASIKLGKEKGNAPWMHKTKWPEGWLPIDTYNKNVDEGMDFKLHFDWEEVRLELIENKGGRFSALNSSMPTESSSKATGLPNGVYPARELYMKKTDGSSAADFTVKDSDTIGANYELAYTLTPDAQFRYYGVLQKFSDQSTSADIYSDRANSPVLKASRLMDEFFSMYKYGVKSRYYTNSKTTKSLKLGDMTEERGCAGGFCTL